MESCHEVIPCVRLASCGEYIHVMYFWCAVGICRRLVAVDIACVLFVFALVLLYFVCIYGLDGL